MTHDNAEAVETTVDGEVVHAVINRPQTRNAVSLAVISGLERVITTAQEHRAKVVVLRGANRTFCSGADLHELRQLIGDPSSLRAFMSRFGAVLTDLKRAPWVTLAAVEGYAVAGGCELLLSCDIVVAAANARIGDGHVEYGLVPAAGSSIRLPQTILPAFARYLLLTGESISGTEAAHKGLAAVAVEPEALDEEVDRIVARLCSRGRDTLRTIKAMLAAGHTDPDPPSLRHELDLFLDHVGQDTDAQVGLQAFHDGVPASFDDSAHR